ncbi:MAG: DnaB-like helicase C-terminal domain-containing protein [Crocinitomicaceae bacterium]
MKAVKIKELNKKFSEIENWKTKPHQREIENLEDLYLAIKQKDIVAICGSPLAGKTTLLYEFAANRKIKLDEKSALIAVRSDPVETLLGLNDFFQSNLKLFIEMLIHDEFISTEDELIETINNVIAEHQVNTIYIDDFNGCMYQKSFTNFWNKVSELNSQKELTFVLTADISRALELRGGDSKPRFLSDIESPEIEKVATKIYSLYRPENYGFPCDENGNDITNKIQIEVMKNKGGKVGNSLDYELRFPRFID